jgi:NADH pyrophosphatase NudC (nudix superfamily)
MTSNWELSTGHQISVDNQGAQTVVTVLQTSAGQQQRTSNSFTTGIWIVPPEMIITSTGGILKIATPSGESIIQIQGNHIQLQSSHSDTSQSTSTSTSFSSGAEPFAPMQMGNMRMKMEPMVMRMGDMELNMNMNTTASKQQFCTQCGTSVKPTDKFCASCGHRLES